MSNKRDESADQDKYWMNLYNVFGLTAYTSIVFFFSSRRRHTRLQGDWSSDVCSSDLLARLLRIDRLFRLKVLPISIALPWILNVGDFLGHIPLPAKISVRVLDPINLRREFGPDPDVDKVYDKVLGRMQATLDHLNRERTLPVIG